MVPVINLYESPWELSPPQVCVSEAPPPPPPSITTCRSSLQCLSPRLLIYLSLNLAQPRQDGQVVDVGFHGDALAAFNQKVMKTPLPPLHPLLRFSLRGSARRTSLPFLAFPMSLCTVVCCRMLIYANKPCLLCPPIPPLSVSLSWLILISPQPLQIFW